MMNCNWLRALTVGACALSVSVGLSASVQAAYPEKPITMIVAYDAGGSTDVTARILAPFIEKNLGGTRIEVVTRPGAGGEIGFAALADAAPDGYTLGFINTPNLLSIPIERQARFSIDRIDPLVNIVDDPNIWTVNAESPFQSVKDVIEFAKANPNTVTLGTTGVGSDDQLAMLAVQRQAGVKFTHVPFSGSGANQKAMIAKKIQICGQNIGEGLRALENKEPVRILGVMSKAPLPVAPGVKTFKEQGYDIVGASLRGIALPKGVPPEIRTKLVEAILAAAKDPEFVAKAAAKETFQPLRILGPEEFTAELEQIKTELTSLWKDAPWLK